MGSMLESFQKERDGPHPGRARTLEGGNNSRDYTLLNAKQLLLDHGYR